MTKSQSYIGAPNGIVLCIDKREREQLSGRFWHAYRRDAVAFRGIHQLIRKMEEFFDEIRFPFPSTNIRTFGEEVAPVARDQEKRRVMTDQEMLEKRGDLGSFVVRVQHRQNSSWQGRLTWVEEDKTVCFRSIWEMIKLVESALDRVGAEKEEEEISWEE